MPFLKDTHACIPSVDIYFKGHVEIIPLREYKGIIIHFLHTRRIISHRQINH